MPDDQIIYTASGSVYTFEENEKISSSIRSDEASTF